MYDTKTLTQLRSLYGWKPLIESGSLLCHKIRHHSVRETVQSGASGCESDRTLCPPFSNNKPRRKAGLCGSVLGRAGKRENGFEPSTFTLAT